MGYFDNHKTSEKIFHKNNIFRFIFLGLLLVVILINIAQFTSIDSRLPINWKSLYKWEKSNLLETNAVRKRYGLFIALSEIAPNAIIIVPPNKPPAYTRLPPFKHRIYGIGRINGYKRGDYDPVNYLVDFQVEDDHNVLQGYYDDIPYMIVYGNETPKKFIFLIRNGVDILFIDTNLIPTQVFEGVI